jgi:hypothetical protein
MDPSGYNFEKAFTVLLLLTLGAGVLLGFAIGLAVFL